MLIADLISTMAMHTCDSLWKGILEDLFEDFLRFFFKDADKTFDMQKGFGFLDKELAALASEEGLRHPVFVDKLVKVFTRTGIEQWILVHVEVQGYIDQTFASRMFTYFYRIRDKYEREVTAITIFTDDHENYCPDRYSYSYMGTSLVYRFNTYKIRHQEVTDLEKSNNPFAMVILAVLVSMQRRKLQPDDLIQLTTGLVKLLFRKGYPKERINGLLVFIKIYVHFGRAEELIKFESATAKINQKIKHMGIVEQVLEMAREEGLAQGREQGIEQGILAERKRIVSNLLANSQFSVQQIAELASVDTDMVVEAKAQLLRERI